MKFRATFRRVTRNDINYLRSLKLKTSQIWRIVGSTLVKSVPWVLRRLLIGRYITTVHRTDWYEYIVDEQHFKFVADNIGSFGFSRLNAHACDIRTFAYFRTSTAAFVANYVRSATQRGKDVKLRGRWSVVILFVNAPELATVVPFDFLQSKFVTAGVVVRNDLMSCRY